MDEQEIEALLDDLHDLLTPVVNTGANRDQLHIAAKKALGLVEEAYAELGIEDEDELEIFTDEGEDDDDDGGEREEDEPVEQGEEEEEEEEEKEHV